MEFTVLSSLCQEDLLLVLRFLVYGSLSGRKLLPERFEFIAHPSNWSDLLSSSDLQISGVQL